MIQGFFNLLQTMEKNKNNKILGSENISDIKKGLDKLLTKYRKKADDLGYEGQLKMKREEGVLTFYVMIE